MSNREPDPYLLGFSMPNVATRPTLEQLIGYWGVPASTLLAYQIDASGRTPQVDITLWDIESVHGSYFFGTSYASVGGVCSVVNLHGMISPTYNVQILFTNSDSHAYITGLGYFEPNYRNQHLHRKGLFTMQMNTPPTTLNPSSVIHSSYMFPIAESDVTFARLPGTPTLSGDNTTYMSVPEFIAYVNANVPAA